jgi:hypothetical protein
MYERESALKNTVPFKLPPRSKNPFRVVNYLANKRGLDKGIVTDHIRQGKILQSEKFGNCLFVGYDEQGVARYATARGTCEVPGKMQFKKDVPGSDKSYGFMMPGRSKTVYVFESAIDAISHATFFKINDLDYTEDTRISLGGVSPLALDRYLSKHEVKEIAFCLDNDDAGRKAAMKMMEQYMRDGREVCYMPPQLKDYNEDLLRCRQELCEEMEM